MGGERQSDRKLTYDRAKGFPRQEELEKILLSEKVVVVKKPSEPKQDED